MKTKLKNGGVMRLAYSIIGLLMLTGTAGAAEKPKPKMVGCSEIVLEPRDYRGKVIETTIKFYEKVDSTLILGSCGNDDMFVDISGIPKEQKRNALKLHYGEIMFPVGKVGKMDDGTIIIRATSMTSTSDSE